jgi:hypothetical protein
MSTAVSTQKRRQPSSHKRKGSHKSEGSCDHYNNEKTAASHKRDRSRNRHKNESAAEYVGTQNRPTAAVLTKEKTALKDSRDQQEGSRGSDKREGSRSLIKKEESRDYLKREGSCERAAVIDTKETEP